jgi:uncharacterized protein
MRLFSHCEPMSASLLAQSDPFVITVCMMLKAPVPGQVKTRLALALGAEQACEVYRALVEHQLAQIPLTWRVEVHGTPEAELPLLEAWLSGRNDLTFYPQSAGDLGQRMEAATLGAFARRASAVVLVGGDCAELNTSRLLALVEALQRVAVGIIPALDGGYVALAMLRHVPAMFRDMPWSQPLLMEQTRLALTDAQVVWEEMPACRDVDVLADWESTRPLLAK